MKIGIYSPYLHILGGGERYFLSIAQALSQQHEVFLFSDEKIKKKAKSIFDISLSSKVHFLADIFSNKNIFTKYISLWKFDAFFYMTDGSFFFPTSRRNFLMIQSPVHIPTLTPLNNLKLINWRIICYSQFMQKIILDKLGKSATILSPCVDIRQFKTNSTPKENIILSVGRFFPYPHNKKHDLLIDIFKKNYQKYFLNWKLIIAGGLTEEGGKEILTDLKKRIGQLPVEIMTNPKFDQLVNLYKKAKIYWHAAGFTEDIKRHPERTEHFGITTLEAMAAGSVPVVFAAGGQKDIVADSKNGYLWEENRELVNKTFQLINNKNLLEKLSRQAMLRAEDFSCDKFYGKIEKIITG